MLVEMLLLGREFSDVHNDEEVLLSGRGHVSLIAIMLKPHLL